MRLSCTLSQHNLSRGLFDRFRTLWGSWVVEDLRSHKRAYFTGNTAYRAVRHDGGGEEHQDDNVLVCPAFWRLRSRVTAHWVRITTWLVQMPLGPPCSFAT